MSEERRAAWAKVNKKSGIAKALHNLAYWTGIDIEPIQAVVKNPEKVLVAIDPSMPPEFRICNTCANWPDTHIARCEGCKSHDKWEAR